MVQPTEQVNARRFDINKKFFSIDYLITTNSVVVFFESGPLNIVIPNKTNISVRKIITATEETETVLTANANLKVNVDITKNNI